MKAQQAMQEAITAYQRGDLGRAEQICAHVLAADRNCFDALNVLGVIAARTSRGSEARELFRRAVAVEPHNAGAHNNYGNALKHARRFEEALKCYEQALRFAPDFLEAHLNRGVMLHRLNRCDEALASLRNAQRLSAAVPEIYFNIGNVLRDMNRPDEALENYAIALRLKPDFAPALNNRSVVLLALKQPLAALASSDSSLRLNPHQALALKNRGDALYDLRRLDAALESYGMALEADPQYAEAWYNRANLLLESNRLAEALESYDRALELHADYADSPDYAHTHFNRGNIHVALGRPEEALRCFEKAMSILPDCNWVFGTWLRTKMMLCDWADLDVHRAALCAAITNHARVALPFTVLTLIDSPPLQRRAAQIRVADQYPRDSTLPPVAKRARADKIRLGYYSADFHNHATAYLIAELFERHDRRRFEVLALSFGADLRDDMRRRIEGGVDRFIDVRRQTDGEVAELSRRLEIDIAIDLKGFTLDARHGIFFHRAAPVQVNYLGYPGTLGAPWMDYLIADETVVPRRHFEHYAEKIVLLPGCYQVNDARRKIADRAFTRTELGLPPQGFVFCCFNNCYKITPETFAAWMRILREVSGSVLWLLEGGATAMANLRREAQARGVDPGRLVFARRLPLPEHLARHRMADLFLDTLPVNAHTTASDALWSGLPVLTRSGESFSSRVAASLLKAVGMSELCVDTEQQYVALAIALANDPPRISRVRAKLNEQRLTAPLFDTERFTLNLEHAYSKMIERYQAGQPPDHITV